jgi:hypothetical protein
MSITPASISHWTNKIQDPGGLERQARLFINNANATFDMCVSLDWLVGYLLILMTLFQLYDL